MKFTRIVFLLCAVWDIFFYYFAPKQAYMQGLLESWYMANGLAPYKDFVNAYPPFLKGVMYIFHSIFGYGLWTSSALSLLFTLLVLSILYVFVTRKIRGRLQFIPLVFFTLWNSYLGGNLFSATSFLGLLLLLSYLSWERCIRSASKARAVTTGILFSASVLTIQIVAPFFAVLTIGFITLCAKRRWKYVSFFFLGGAIPVLLTILWVYAQNIVPEFLYWNVAYYFGGYPYSALHKELSAVLAFVAIHVPVMLYSIARGIDRKHKAWTITAVAALLLSFWNAVFHPMRFQVSLPLMSALLGLGIDRYPFKTKKSLLVGMVIGINVVCFILYIAPNFHASISTKNTHRLISEVYPNDPMYDTVEWTKTHTAASSRVFVLGDAYFYLAAKRLPANHRNALGVEPIVFHPLSTFQNEIKSAQPDYWMIDERLFLTYSNWSQDVVSATIKDFLSCQKIVAQFEYWTLYENITTCTESK